MDQSHTYLARKKQSVIPIFIYIGTIIVLCFLLRIFTLGKNFNDTATQILIFLFIVVIIWGVVMSILSYICDETIQVTNESLIINKKKETQIFSHNEIQSILVRHVSVRNNLLFPDPFATFIIVVSGIEYQYSLAWKNIVGLQESLQFFHQSGIKNFEEIFRYWKIQKDGSNFEKKFVFIFGGLMILMIIALLIFARTQLQ